MNDALLRHVEGGAACGDVYLAGTRGKVGDDVFRELDVLFVPDDQACRRVSEISGRSPASI